MDQQEQQISDAEKFIKVFSARKNAYIEVSLSRKNPDEDQLGGVMPVMLVTDHPLTDRAQTEHPIHFR